MAYLDLSSFDISPLKIENVVSYSIKLEDGNDVAYITYCDGSYGPLSWNVRLVLQKNTSFNYLDLPSRSVSPSNTVNSTFGLSSEGETFFISSLKLLKNNNAKDNLVYLSGRECLVLGTVEADSPDALSPDLPCYLLYTYDFYQSASMKYSIPTFFYYSSFSGRMFLDPYLSKLNKILFIQSTEHYFFISPKWDISKISEIYKKGGV